MLDVAADVVYIVNMICLFFFVGYYDAGVVVLERNKVQRHYLQNRFVFDMVASLPIDLLFW